MDIRKFLEEMDSNSGNLLFEEGKEGWDKIDPAFRNALAAEGVEKPEWVYQPDGYDLVVMENDKDGEKKGSWSIAFFTEAKVDEPGKKPGLSKKEKMSAFGDSLDLLGNPMNEAVGAAVIKKADGDFLEIVQLAIEIASKKEYKKGGFTAQTVNMAIAAAKSKSKSK